MLEGNYSILYWGEFLTETSRYKLHQMYELMPPAHDEVSVSEQTCKSRCRLDTEEVSICRLLLTRRFLNYKWFLFIRVSVILKKSAENN